MSFVYSQKVRVQHCDPAGSVFYPRYFEMLTVCTEEWLVDRLGVSMSELMELRGIGAPTLKIEAEFRAPARLGETLDWAVRPVQLGRSSCHVRYEVGCKGQPRVAFLQTMVLIDMASRRSTPWPEDLRQRIAAEMAASQPGTAG